MALFSEIFEDCTSFAVKVKTNEYVNQPFFLGADGGKLLKAKSKDADYKYLYYALRSVRIPDTGYNRHFKWLKEADIKYPDIKTQKQIVLVLDKLSDLISHRKDQLTELDNLIKARFVEQHLYCFLQ